jgi:hypothetical protein
MPQWVPPPGALGNGYRLCGEQEMAQLLQVKRLLEHRVRIARRWRRSWGRPTVLRRRVENARPPPDDLRHRGGGPSPYRGWQKSSSPGGRCHRHLDVARWGARAVLGSHLRRLWQRWPWDDGGQGPQAGSGYDPVTDFALGDPDSLPARLTAALLSRVGVDGTQVCRRRNYRFLLARVPDAVQWSFPSS